MSAVDLAARIPNNVGLADDPRLQRALEGWLPKYLDWWRELGPVEHQDHEVFLRTATAVGQEGWAHFDHVRMPDYRWGIFLAEPEQDRPDDRPDHDREQGRAEGTARQDDVGRRHRQQEADAEVAPQPQGVAQP